MERWQAGDWLRWCRDDLPNYLRYILIAALVVGGAFLFQLYYVYETFTVKMVLAPAGVTLFIGLILGRIAILKQRLERTNEQFRAVADLAEEFTFYRRIDGGFDYVSPACRTITGYSPEEMVANPVLLDQLIHPEDEQRWQHHCNYLRESGLPQSIDVRLINRKGETVWISHTAVPVYDTNTNRVIGVRATSLDITQRKRYEEYIERQANYDPLTSLPNRRLMRQRMVEMIATNGDLHHFAVLFLDLDRFKYLNDSRGHTFGDELLKMLGRRLRENFDGNSVVSRFGGDEFVILLPEVSGIEAAARVAHHLLEIVEIPFMVEGAEYTLTGSIGIALYPEDGSDADTLIRNADAAMYRSKRSVSGKVQRYLPSIVADAASFLALEGEVRRGLQRGEFLPYYQPKVALESNTIVGFEALARWHRSDGTLGSPELFIPVAEETGMIHAMAEQILDTVCHQLQAWQERGLQLPVAVNVSGVQFAEPDFVERIEQLINAYRLEPRLLELEITEQVLINDIDEAINRLNKLRTFGIRIALDDFGTGYSSLNYLCQLPIDQVKIDRSFIAAAQQGGKKMQVLKYIISLCNELQLEIVAEGIESAEHLQMMRELGCRIGQGYYFHRPLPAREIDALH